MRRYLVIEEASFLRDFIFASNDGLITTFALVAGSFGASFSEKVVVALGLANIFADGFAMASGNYLGIKSEMEYEEAKVKKSLYHLPAISHAFITFLSFVVSGFVPLLPYLLRGINNRFMISTFLVFGSLFIIGSLRTIYSKRGLVIEGLEMLFVGGVSAIVAFLIGYFVKGVVI